MAGGTVPEYPVPGDTNAQRAMPAARGGVVVRGSARLAEQLGWCPRTQAVEQLAANGPHTLDEEGGQHQGDSAEELDEYVERWPSGILEGIANRIPDDDSGVYL